MNRHECKMIRREIDEATLDARLTLEASEHLSKCDECRRFHDDRRLLRGLMANLETVGAPADFDFRLRARMAREKPSNGYGGLLFTARPIAAVAVVVLFAVVAVVVHNRMSAIHNQPVVSVPVGNEVRSTAKPVLTATATPPDRLTHTRIIRIKMRERPLSLPKPAPGTQTSRGSGRSVVARKTANSPVGSGQRFGTRDSAATGAAVVTPGAPAPLSLYQWTNGHSQCRSIMVVEVPVHSLPPVTFGSQRLLAGEASFVPISSAKGNW